MILVVDPSSSVTGLALFRDEAWPDRGYPEPVSAQAVRPVSVSRAGDRLSKTLRMLDAIRFRVAAWRGFGEMTLAVVEVPGGVQGRQRNRTAAMATYCVAVGAVIGYLDESGLPIDQVQAGVWTRGVPKDRRIGFLRASTSYESRGDAGGDVADAWMLGLWWLQRRQHLRRIAPPPHKPSTPSTSEATTR